AGTSPANTSTVGFTVTFSESVTGVDTSDFALTTAGVSSASVANVTGSGASYTVTVNTGTGDGTLRLDVADDDSIVDAATNPLGGSGAGNGDFTAGQTYSIDKTAPSVFSINRTSSDPASGPTVGFAVTFNEPVSGVDVTDFTTVVSGLTGSSIAGITGSGTTYNLTV